VRRCPSEFSEGQQAVVLQISRLFGAFFMRAKRRVLPSMMVRRERGLFKVAEPGEKEVVGKG
jgi:hypothetical protein